MKENRINWKMKILKNIVVRSKKAQFGKIIKGICRIWRRRRICRPRGKGRLGMKTLRMKAQVVGFLPGARRKRTGIRIWKLSSFDFCLFF